MNGARVFEDAYSGVFREQEDFFSCLHEIMGNPLGSDKRSETCG